jgi:hypothetical protein
MEVNITKVNLKPVSIFIQREIQFPNLDRYNVNDLKIKIKNFLGTTDLPSTCLFYVCVLVVFLRLCKAYRREDGCETH